MRIAVFSTQASDREYLGSALATQGHELVYLTDQLTPQTAAFARDCPAVCVFVNDDLGATSLQILHSLGVQFIALRCAGYNNVDLAAAGRLGFKVARVPAYSPYAVAEFTVGMILSLNRKYHRAYHRTREGHFGLDGLMGFDLHGRTVGVIGTGKIGEIVCRILTGFGCRVLAHDVRPNPACESLGVSYVSREVLFAGSDIVTLHCPLMPETRYLIRAETLALMRRGVMLVNTSRGGLVDTRAVIDGLKSGQIGSLGLDVYEEETNLFFRDLSDDIIQDDVFARLLTFPNVLITAHQGYFTEDALKNIASTTAQNVADFQAGRSGDNFISLG